MENDRLDRAVEACYELFMATSDTTAAGLADLDLTHATATALIAIDPERDPPTMKALATRVHCNAPNLTFLIDQLASRELVVRSTAVADRRQRAVLLTPKGQRVRERVLAITRASTPLRHLAANELATLVEAMTSALEAESSSQRTAQFVEKPQHASRPASSRLGGR